MSLRAERGNLPIGTDYQWRTENHANEMSRTPDRPTTGYGSCHPISFVARLSLEQDTVVLFFFAAQADLEAGRFGIHRAIKEEGIAA
jgi:hypothetical protein